ncbi:hypothetical protein [Shewanella sp. S23-S33]|uniref:hypothetical protein n=1 Tax=Shewanella sp. S23-S33 TaxID=3342769 RepID=UPI00372D6E6F
MSTFSDAATARRCAGTPTPDARRAPAGTLSWCGRPPNCAGVTLGVGPAGNDRE